MKRAARVLLRKLEVASLGSLYKYHRLGGIKKQKLILTQFEAESKIEVVGKFDFFWSISAWLQMTVFPPCPHTGSLLYACVCVLSLYLQNLFL